MTLRIDPQQVVGTGVVCAERGVVQNDGGMSKGTDTVGEENGRSSKPRLTPDLLIYQRSCIETESVNGACMGTRSFHICYTQQIQHQLDKPMHCYIHQLDCTWCIMVQFKKSVQLHTASCGEDSWPVTQGHN